MMGRALIAVTALIITTSAADAASAPFHFSTKAEGQAAATQADGFFEAMGTYELKLRAADLQHASLADVREQYRTSVLDWDAAVQLKVEASLARISAGLQPFTPLLPSRVDLVYVGSNFEDALPHTRGNAIFLPTVISSIDAGLLDFVMAHEIFHVLSRASTADRDRFYASIGFRRCGFQPPASLLPIHITNPDAPVDDHYLTVGSETFVPYVYGREAVVTKPLQLGENLMTRLVTVQVEHGRCTPITGEDERPVLSKASDIPHFFDVVGKDSSYVTHPEELLADNFALLVTDRGKSKSPGKLMQIEAELTAAAVEAAAQASRR